MASRQDLDIMDINEIITELYSWAARHEMNVDIRLLPCEPNESVVLEDDETSLTEIDEYLYGMENDDD